MVLVLALVVLAVAVGLSVLLGLIVRDTQRREGNWGLNARPGQCPKCAAPLPTVRAPKNFRQAMWGGWTCAGCGAELDKWGREVK